MDKVFKPNIRVRANPAASDAEEQVRLVGDPAGVSSTKRAPNRGSWKKGTCPNPTGRPRGAKGLKAVTRKLLSEKVTLRAATGPKRVSLYEALLRKELEHAANGDWRARKTIIELGRWAIPDPVELPAPEQLPDATELSPTGQAILDLFAEEIRQERKL